MKGLADTLMEKLDINKVNLENEEFPLYGTMNDVINFLKSNGFIELKYHDDVRIYFDYVEDFNEAGKKCFMVQTRRVGNGGNIIWFGDTRRNNISNDNKLYMITFYAQYNEFEYYGNDINAKFIDTNDFKKELKELFK